MSHALPFGEILEAVESLSLDEQETLLDIIKHRLAERARQRLAGNIAEARAEFAQGQGRAVSVDALMDELLS